MNHHSSRLMMPALLACLLAPAGLRAADPESVVSGTGYVSIDKPADTMRLQVQIDADGASLKEALAALATRSDALKSGLAKLGASEKSVEIGDYAVSDGSNPNDRRAALEQAMRDRMSSSRGGAAPGQAGPKVSVSCTVKADWSLAGSKPDALLLAAQDIKDKIKDSKLLDAPKSAAKSEADEEAAMMASSDGTQSPDTPVFLFVATMTDAEQTKAMGEAFVKAKDSASKLAKSAGSELGALKSLQGQATTDPDQAYAMQEAMGSAYYREAMMAMQRGNSGGDIKEALSATPGKVSMQVVVQASFAIK